MRDAGENPGGAGIFFALRGRLAHKDPRPALGQDRFSAGVKRTNDLNTRTSRRPAATGPRATRSETIARKRPAGNKGLQHSLGFGKTVRGGCQAKLVHAGFHWYEAVG